MSISLNPASLDWGSLNRVSCICMHEIIYVGDNNDNEAQPNFYTCFMSKQKRLTEEKKESMPLKNMKSLMRWKFYRFIIWSCNSALFSRSFGVWNKSSERLGNRKLEKSDQKVSFCFRRLSGLLFQTRNSLENSALLQGQIIKR